MIENSRKYTENTPLLYDKESSSTLLPRSSTSSRPPSSSFGITTPSKSDSPNYCTVTLLLSTFIPSLGGFLYGYDQTVTETILSLPNFQHHYFYGKHLTGGFNPFDYLTFGFFSMAILGTLYGGYVCDQAGRKRSLIGAFLLFALGTFLDISCRHSLAFLTGRLIVGFGSGILLVGAICMVTELSPANLRGCFVGFFSLLTMAGRLSAYYVMIAMGPSISASMASSSASSTSSFYYPWTYDWRTPIALETCVCLIAILVQWQLPDSPRWLIWVAAQDAKIQDEGLLAIASLQELPMSDSRVRQLWKHINDNCETVNSDMTSSYMEFFSLYLSPHYDQIQRKKRFLLACGMVIFNFLTGYDTLVKNYASAIFYASGLHETNLLTANGCTSSLALAASAISLGWCVDNVGRKSVLLVGSVVMAVCHLSLGGVFQWFSVTDFQTGSVLLMNAHARSVAITCVYVFIIIYAFTWNSLVLVTSSEWLLMADRAKGVALVSCLALTAQWLQSVSSPWYFFISPSLIYFVYGFSMLFSCYFVYRWVPNITAESLENIATLVF